MMNRTVCFASALLLGLTTVARAQTAPERTLSEAPIAAPVPKGSRVSVDFDRTDGRYALGESVGLFVTAQEDAYVTVLTVSPRGSVVQLFPNKFQTDNFVPAGKRVQVPDPASGAKLQVSGPVGTEQIRVFSSAKPLKMFADVTQGTGGMFRSLDGGEEAVSRSLDEARSGGAAIGTMVRTLTTVNTLPPAALPQPVASAADEPAQAQPDEQPVAKKPAPVKHAAAKPAPVKPAPSKTDAVAAADKPHRPVRQAVAPRPQTIQTSSVQGTQAGASPGFFSQFHMPQLQMPQMQMPQAQMPQMQMPQMQMPQMQMPQMQMPQMQMPQLQMPQVKLPGGFGLQMPQVSIFGRSAERPQAAADSPEVATAGPEMECPALIQGFNAAIASKDIDAAAQRTDIIAGSASCGAFQVEAQRRLAALRLQTASDMMQAGRPGNDYEPLLAAAAKPQVLWQASAMSGDAAYGERRFAEAAVAYQQAIEIIKNESRTPKVPAGDTIRGLIDRAGQARILAATPSPQSPEGTFVPVGTDHRSGMLGGIYSQDVRGIVPVSIPIPITFDFNQTTFTTIGSEAAKELLEAIKEQKPQHIVLVGHADRQGSAGYNQTLSAKRAEAVASFLKQNGVDASVEAEGRGSSEPIDVAVTANLSDADIDALNRRVEWRRE